MTAGKNQPQTIVFKAVLFSGIGPFPRTRLRFEIVHQLVLRRIESCPSTQSINGFESGRRNQPWSRVAGHSSPRPQAQRSRKGFVHRLLGKIKITEQADQSRQDSSRIHAIKGIYQFAYLVSGTLGHDDDLSKPATPNQFSKRRAAAKCPARESEIWTTERFLGWTMTRKQLVRAVSRNLFRGWTRSAPATSERGDDDAAEIGEIGVGERGALCSGIERSKKSFQESPQCLNSFPKTEMKGAAIGPNHEQRYIVGCQILRESFADFLQQRWNQFFPRDI